MAKSENNHQKRATEQAGRQAVPADAPSSIRGTCEAMLDNVDSHLFVVDTASLDIVFANRRFRATFGNDCVGRKADRYLPVTFDTTGGGPASKDAAPASREVYIEGKDRWLEITVNRVTWVDGRPAHLINGYDITAKKQYEDNIRRLAYLDYLTGLPNRYRCEIDLRESIEKVARTGRSGYLLFIDLDDFKIVNDCYGHDYGDGVLVSFAVFLMDLFTGEDNLVFRLGGDEFVIIMNNSDDARAQAYLDALIERAQKPWHSLGREFYCTLSIGVVPFRSGKEDAKSVMKKADIAMYQAKKAGKNSHARYTRGLGADSALRLDLEGQLRQAMRDGCRGVAAEYQPYSDAATGDIIGAEALMRVRGAGSRLLLPEEFLDLAEYLGLMVPMGEHVIRQAARELKTIHASGLPDFTMTVNLSAKQVMQKDIVPRLEDMLGKAGVNPSRMTIGIQENTAIADPARMNQLSAEFRRLGVRMALDDFGSSASSFVDMRALDVDMVKIASTYIHSVHEPFAARFIRLMTELCHAAGKTVCINGVETREQFDFCRGAGVDMVQGFYLNRPAGIAQLNALLYPADEAAGD